MMKQSKKEMIQSEETVKSELENNDASKPKHDHYGHRQRMRWRFLQSGLEGFQPHEILELLLFYALPRVNTNPIAHELLNRFHSLSGVFDADVHELMRVKGISENAAVFLKLIPQLFRQYELDKVRERPELDSTKQLQAYARAKLMCENVEKLLLLCLDEHLHLLHCETISTGTTHETALDLHRITECAFQVNSYRLVIAHNHPQGIAEFSDVDLFVTKQLKDFLRSVKIQLLDHIVVGKDGKTLSARLFFNWD